MWYSNTRHRSSRQKSKENRENHLSFTAVALCFGEHAWQNIDGGACMTKRSILWKSWKAIKKPVLLPDQLLASWDRLWHQGVLNRVTCRRTTGKTFQMRRLTEAQQWPPWCVQRPPPWCVQPARWWPPQSPILAPLVSSTIEHISSSHDISTIHHFVNL